ncbi:hypothetical protein AeNC1_000878 [Aphanomyces euteiches]|nr:hypothetical protein AeNC1_000878 [Aphanomyces euteiches]
MRRQLLLGLLRNSPSSSDDEIDRRPSTRVSQPRKKRRLNDPPSSLFQASSHDDPSSLLRRFHPQPSSPKRHRFQVYHADGRVFHEPKPFSIHPAAVAVLTAFPSIHWVDNTATSKMAVDMSTLNPNEVII